MIGEITESVAIFATLLRPNPERLRRRARRNRRRSARNRSRALRARSTRRAQRLHLKADMQEAAALDLDLGARKLEQHG